MQACALRPPLSFLSVPREKRRSRRQRREGKRGNLNEFPKRVRLHVDPGLPIAPGQAGTPSLEEISAPTDEPRAEHSADPSEAHLRGNQRTDNLRAPSSTPASSDAIGLGCGPAVN